MIMGGVLYWSAFFSFPRMIKKFKERVHLSWEKLVTFLQVEIWPFEDFDPINGKMLRNLECTIVKRGEETIFEHFENFIKYE